MEKKIMYANKFEVILGKNDVVMNFSWEHPTLDGTKTNLEIVDSQSIVLSRDLMEELIRVIERLKANEIVHEQSENGDVQK